MSAKKNKQPGFDDILTSLGRQQFDVAPAREGATRTAGAVQVRKYGCAAEIAPASDGSVLMVVKPGWVLGGDIARVLDKGYQKFLKTAKLEVPVSADQLRAISSFSDELKAAAGTETLYNEALGAVSDVYIYDRVKGREKA